MLALKNRNSRLLTVARWNIDTMLWLIGGVTSLLQMRTLFRRT